MQTVHFLLIILLAELFCESLYSVSELLEPHRVARSQSMLATSDEPSKLVSDPQLVSRVSFDDEWRQIEIEQRCDSSIETRYHLLTALHVVQRRPVDILQGLSQLRLAVRVLATSDHCNVLALLTLYVDTTLQQHGGLIGQC